MLIVSLKAKCQWETKHKKTADKCLRKKKGKPTKKTSKQNKTNEGFCIVAYNMSEKQ